MDREHQELLPCPSSARANLNPSSLWQQPSMTGDPAGTMAVQIFNSALPRLRPNVSLATSERNSTVTRGLRHRAKSRRRAWIAGSNASRSRMVPPLLLFVRCWRGRRLCLDRLPRLDHAPTQLVVTSIVQNS